ncbi:ATP-binding protein [Desulfobacter curvatus]|uniref:ATP-binding protein n=1 Tax=Desulfobacter curvatus TaxID=2290 RepID=UPI000367AF82|nr:ATP-binding protein [Desulfobacter curvatus]
MADQIRKTPALKDALKQRSLAGTLTLLLTLTVTVVALTVAGILYVAVSKSEYRQLEEKADEFISSIDDVLEIPLWNMDRENIQKIAQAYTDNELFEYLEIRDNLNTSFFNYFRNRNAPVIGKSSDIFHGGRLVGHIDVAFTTQGLIHRNHKILLSGLGILAIIIFALTLVTGLFFRAVLKNLFRRLNAISDAYALGKDIMPEHEIPYREFQSLIGILGDMRDTLNMQVMEIKTAEKKYRTIFENAVEGIFQSTPDGHFINVNPAMARMLGYKSPQDLIQSISNIGEQLYVSPGRREEFIRQIKTQKEVTNFHTEFRTADGGTVWLSFYSRSVRDDNGKLEYIEGMALDISQQKKAEEERKKLEAQLIHSQKLESVGRLAGGVAHDFNNMLSIILGYSDMMLQTVTPKDPNYERLVAISSAANRSAGLTGQLLTFASQQTVSPKILDLNKKIQDMINMLKRLLREDIDLQFLPGEDIGMVNIDPSQLDQILVNLCINARDAIVGIGQISIATGHVFMDEKYCRQHSDVVVGDYVTLSVRDNGCGMEPSMLDNIFEPFFTTKEDSKGSGLGLSTVYGIVKQNNGSIHVHSEPGKGTVVTVRLPESRDVIPSVVHDTDTNVSSKGNETILLVEDEETLLNLCRETLEQMGYTVLATDSPREALRIAAEHPGEIQLLMTDIVMPGMNGLELADKLIREHPGIRCLYVSGYTTDVFFPNGVVEEGSHFLQKPYTKNDLKNMLRRILS